ncbi:MAG TPA: hypothetical protein VFJ29_06695 [Candidatus Kapabacteria bacterium]|nr:hypothetical protein [Candidatus Kapabacteria bacterium]
MKTLTDPDTIRIDTLNVIQSSISDQQRLTPPQKELLHEHTPRMKDEERVYKLTGRLVRYKEEEDFDYHIALVGKDNDTMLVEIPSPTDCDITAHSLYKSYYTMARNTFLAVLKKHKLPEPQFQKHFKPKENDPIFLTVAGVGFWDFKHDNEYGAAPNGRELHPVLKLEEK